MPFINEQQLKKQLSQGSFSKLYLIYGEEKYLVKHYTDTLVKKAVPRELADFNLHIYEGSAGMDLLPVSEAVEALPVFSERTCILIKDMPLDSLLSGTAAALEELISDIPETTVLVISNPNTNINPKSKTAKKLIALISKYGDVAEFGRASISQLIKLLQRGASQRGCELGYSEASHLVSLAGDDMNDLLNELEKVCAYKGNGTISKDDIEAVAVKNVQARAFDLAKAVNSGNADAAMSLVNSLFIMKEDPIILLAALMTPYIDMYRAKVYTSGGLRASDAAADFNYRNKEFRLTNAARNASGYTISQLRAFLEILERADYALKNTSASARMVIEKTVAYLILAANGEEVCLE
ncbi:MAG: DNA polymerase III subunit delta [Clostridia bacterium]|nr:DNA polymerase III subunit delta [Clostridia bacterium]